LHVIWRYMSVKILSYCVDAEQNPIAKLDDELKGARIFLLDNDVHLLHVLRLKLLKAISQLHAFYARVTRSFDV